MYDSIVTISYGAANLKMISSMEFDCKLAHKSDIKKISNFGSIRQLYERISQAFGVSTEQILFCTLNTNKFRDMNSLLGNFLSIGDLIVAHICGETKSFSFKKKFEFLGLTITDNGLGRAFVKRVNSDDMDLMRSIKPGQHIVAINSESTVGLRHFEVARALREVPVDSEITLRLMDPLCSQEYNSNETDGEYGESEEKNLPTRQNEQLGVANRFAISGTYSFDSLSDDLMNSSLPIERLLMDSDSSRGEQSNYKHIIEEINSTLESFLGINDTILAIQIYRLAKENKEFEEFIAALRSSELSVFKFGPETERSLWICATK